MVMTSDGNGNGDGYGDGSGSGYGYGYGYGDGYGYGYGYGDGYGYGSGYGSGDGSGYCSGDGSGYGYGDGSGSGYGSGDGYGYGDGSGYGYGDGSGSGYGSGDGDGDGSGKLAYFGAILASYQAPGQILGFWRSDRDGEPSNGGRGGPAIVGLKQEIPGPLILCTRALHASLDPTQWKGERWWVVALDEPVARDGDKMGSLRRTIIADLGKCPF